ncbi:hypothetical protein Glove_33g160 [Diversispora epigaea]|uniref:G-protein coupled receptors family 1 profile domain-containing protein n=1 Tax=Diversispora epigaea TaxID=1348612 RepID=A0A397JHR6_9GLOM|nr:hypothetical protein Glove_33g160 [Diversispora epigaea]
MISDYQNDAYTGFLLGASIMVFLHNTFVSFLLYKMRKSNISNINKIIINISGTILFLLRFISSFAPIWVDLLTCKLLNYLSEISSFFFRESLAFFLLWRLSQIGNNKIDKWASIILFSARTISHLVMFGFIKVVVYPTTVRNWCSNDVGSLFISETISVVIDFSIDLYVTFRLIQILRRANKNLLNINVSMKGNAKRTLFTGVMYWNFVRLGVAFLLNLNAIVSLITDNLNSYITIDQLAAIRFFNVFAFVLMSYVITVDAEIVKIIQGKDQNDKESDKSKHEERSPSTNATYKNASSESLPKHNTLDLSNDIQTYDVSFERLSFFEWYNAIMGFQHEKKSY